MKILCITAALLIATSSAQAEDGGAFISITASPFASMNADKDSYGRDEDGSERFDMHLHQGYGLRAGAMNMYASLSEAQTQRDTEIPDAQLTTVALGFITEEEDTAYPIGLYSRFGAGLGGGKLRYASGAREETDFLLEVFAEGGLKLNHHYQIGVQLKAQSLFEIGNTRALLGEAALVLGVGF
ncbi:MAG: hypothetical protein RL497_3014 [Pseudomonadota bacterium]|jgi:hypothetical protein